MNQFNLIKLSYFIYICIGFIYSKLIKMDQYNIKYNLINNNKQMLFRVPQK